MGKGGGAKKNKPSNGANAKRGPDAAAANGDDDDSILNAAAAENSALQQKAAQEAADAAVAALNALPVFAIANSDKKPLQFKLGLGEQQMAIFYADVEAAKAQLATTKKSSPNLGCDLITVGLGTAHRLSCEGKAMVVPSEAELRAAGAPEGIQPMGIEMPLFACMKMLGVGEDERSVLPVFMSFADCAKAVAQAQAAAPGEVLEISTLSLQSVYEQLTDPSFGKTFSFIAPSASLHHVEHYLGQGVYMRRVEDERDAVPPLQ